MQIQVKSEIPSQLHYETHHTSLCITLHFPVAGTLLFLCFFHTLWQLNSHGIQKTADFCGKQHIGGSLGLLFASNQCT